MAVADELHMIFECPALQAVRQRYAPLFSRTLEFWNKIATSHVGSLFHTVLLDNLDDAFSVANGAKDFSGSIATCLQSVGQPMPFGRDGVPILEVSTIIEAMRQHLGGTHDYALHCPRAAPSVGVVAMYIPPLV